MEELERASADQCFGRVAEHLGEGGVHRRERLLEVEDTEPERGAFEALPVPLLGLDALGLGLAPVADVTDVGDPTRDRGLVLQVGEHLLHPAPRAVGLPEAPLDGRGADARDGVGHGVAVAGDVVGVDELAARGADEVVGVVAETPGGGAGVRDVAVGVDHEGDVGRTLHERAEALFRLHERVARLDQLGDVAGDLGDADDRAGRVVHR